MWIYRKKANIQFVKGFTLVELIIALMVSSIILTAVVSFSFAMSRATDVCDDSGEKQAQVRFVAIKFSDLIKNCRLICTKAGNDFVLWRADDNGNGLININEILYIGSGGSESYVRMLEFESSSNPAIFNVNIGAASTGWWHMYGITARETMLIPQCSGVTLKTDVAPPQTRFAAVSFDIDEDGVTRNYQIGACLRSWAGHLLGSSGSITLDDDE
ncbi:MAG: PilW family protein [Planctomycetota bacterium]|jgi:prepilin-type N-terminal cleavage/methylation domain-containing protein